MASAGEIGRPKLPNDGDLDLARVLEVFLELPCDLSRKLTRIEVGDIPGIYDYPHLAAGLQCKDMIHTGKLQGQGLETLETLDIALQGLSPRPGPGGRDRIGGLDDHGEDRSRLHLVVMGFDAVDDGRVLIEPPCYLGPNECMRAFNLVCDRLPDVVEECRRA